MAAIDRIYVESYEQYCQFRDWCLEQPPLYDKYGKEVKLIDYVYKHSDTFKGGVVFSGHYYLDAYLIRNCPLDFIQEELMLNYGYWSQKRIKEYYNNVKNWNGEGECPYWAKLEDFIFLEDETMTIRGLEKSTYERIKDNELFTNPKRDAYEYGKHFRCVKHPKVFFNRPFGCKRWFVNIQLPNLDCMWYHDSHNSWDFYDEFVACSWSSSSATVKTIKALKRLMLKWKLPIGTKVIVTGKYIPDDYEFVIVK